MLGIAQEMVSAWREAALLGVAGFLLMMSLAAIGTCAGVSSPETPESEAAVAVQATGR